MAPPDVASRAVVADPGVDVAPTDVAPFVDGGQPRRGDIISMEIKINRSIIDLALPRDVVIGTNECKQYVSNNQY